MNSYPAELLVQLAPVMFVAGLDGQKPSTSGTSSSHEGSTTSVLPSPRRTNSSDQFSLLTHRLREALVAQRKPAIWVPEPVRKSKIFHVVFVDKTVQFPPRKIPDPTSSQPPHSPLSPLHPSSPLHPDGIIAPIWIRKHTSLVPSVFVVFLRLFENPTPLVVPRSPLEPDAPEVMKEREERDKEDRRHDTELAREIADRKKTTSERGMKLTVVLLASRRMLDDPTLDGRLTFIRRTSGLDARAALFVLSPVSATELSDFVKSLQQALFDSAIEYYTSHAKRVRRKRNRHTQSSTSAQHQHGIAPSVRTLPLRPEGWTVRYEYKMACFAEFRGEEEVALKHYQDAYSALLTMFGSPTVLPPRTKRWAEAKVLADSINIKICKLFLYNAEHALALSQLRTHVRRFSDLSSRVWGIGEDTYEFWSWIARQYRVFAELLEQGTYYGLTIPSHAPTPTTGTPSIAGQAQNELDALQSHGVNPSTALMHAGFYYYFAAECTERRRMRFLTALENEAAVQAPGFLNEKKVDHLASILELYTKAYELYKKYSPAQASTQNQMQGRFTLWIAYRIAQTYYQSGKYDMSVRFFERITRTYSRENWGTVLQPLLATWYACAQQLDDVEMSVRLLVEMIARGRAHQLNEQDDEETVVEDLQAILKSTVPSSNESLVIDLTESEPLFDSSVIFWVPEMKLDERVAFQISLTIPERVVLSGLPISLLNVSSSNGHASITVRHVTEEGAGEEQQLPKRISHVDVGHLTLPQDGKKQVEASLDLQSGSMIVIAGTISSEIPQELKFTRAEICISKGSWNIQVPFNISRRRDAPLSSPKWLILSPDEAPRLFPIRRTDASSVTVKRRPHQVDVVLSHRPPAYIDEPYPISVDVTNNDDRDLVFSLDVLLQPGDDDAVNSIAIDDSESSGLIKGILIGTIQPGVTACKILRLKSSGTAGERMVDFSVQSRMVTSSSDSDSDSDSDPSVSDAVTSEVLQTLVVPTISPFVISHETTYSRRTTHDPGPVNLSAYDSSYWDDSEGGRASVTTTFECVESVGASSMVIEGIVLDAQENPHTKIIHCSLDAEDFPSEFLPGDQFSIVCEFSLAPPDDFFTDPEATLNASAKYSINWRRLSDTDTGRPGLLASTQLPLPPLKPPSDGIVALLHAPPFVHLHEPFLLELVIRNHHPTRSACPAVSLELEPIESFVAAGIRNGRLPTLIPGAEEKVIWQLIPLECGPEVPLPRIKVTDRRRAAEYSDGGVGSAPQQEMVVAGDEIRIVDVRWDRRRSDGSYVMPEPKEGDHESTADSAGVVRSPSNHDGRFTVIVSPA